MRRVRVVVQGLVQGVGFRFSAQAEAQRRAVTGWVRNRADGAVELEIQGDDDAVHAMLDWCRSGPRSAQVESVHVDDLDMVADEGGFGVTS